MIRSQSLAAGSQNVAAAATVTAGTVPADQVWLIRSIALGNITSNAKDIEIYVVRDAVFHLIETVDFPAEFRGVMLDTFLVLEAGDELVLQPLEAGILTWWVSGSQLNTASGG